jgi:hypothetical protein
MHPQHQAKELKGADSETRPQKSFRLHRLGLSAFSSPLGGLRGKFYNLDSGLCITSASFAVLVNGQATNFFKSGRGLRQGCPLSPYLFILIMESLSLLLSKSSSDHLISGIKITNLIKIVHLMFVDDVLLMSKADPEEWSVILEVLRLFSSVSGLSINPYKIHRSLLGTLSGGTP